MQLALLWILQFVECKRGWLKAWPFIYLWAQAHHSCEFVRWAEEKERIRALLLTCGEHWNFDEFSLCFGIEGSSFKPEVELGIIGLGNSTSFNFGIDVYKQCRRDSRDLLRHVDVKAQIPSPWIAKFTSLSLRLSSSEVLFCTLDVASIWNCQRQVFLLSTYYLFVEHNLRW